MIKLQKTMNRELRKIRKWLAANHLALNIEKTNYVIFHSPNRKISEPISIKIGRKRIRGENTVKFLDVLLDSNLNWKPHITELSKKLARTVGVFFKVQMKCFLFIPEFERAAKIRKIAVYRFLISFLVPEL